MRDTGIYIYRPERSTKQHQQHCYTVPMISRFLQFFCNSSALHRTFVQLVLFPQVLNLSMMVKVCAFCELQLQYGAGGQIVYEGDHNLSTAISNHFQRAYRQKLLFGHCINVRKLKLAIKSG